MKVLNIDEVEGEKFSKGAVRKILVHSDNMMIVYNEAPPGGKLSHSHPHEQMGYIIKGNAKLTAGDKEAMLRAGSSYSLEPYEHHEFEAMGDEPLVVLDVFNPPREDYLPSK